MEEWKQKAVSSNDKANELQAQIFMLKEEIHSLRKEPNLEAARAATAQNKSEKLVLVCHMKENQQQANIHTQFCSSPTKTVTLPGNRQFGSYAKAEQ